VTDERAEHFRVFLDAWKKENVVALYDQRIDPSDRTYLIQQRALRLKEEAREKGMLSLLYDEMDQRDVVGYEKDLFASADSKKKLGDHR
jgi:hypothetical protein